MNWNDIWGMTMVQRAERVAVLAHAEQVDKNGVDYIEHPRAVAHYLADASEEVQAAAWLHDVLEDSDVTSAELIALFPASVVMAVQLLTRRSDVDDEIYYTLIRGNEIALLVKEADIKHNTLPARTAKLDDATRERLKAKYARARVMLGLADHD